MCYTESAFALPRRFVPESPVAGVRVSPTGRSQSPARGSAGSSPTGVPDPPAYPFPIPRLPLFALPRVVRFWLLNRITLNL